MKSRWVTVRDGAGLRGAEFAHPAALPVGAEAIAEIPHGAARRAPLVVVPSGSGLLMFSGLLDAWRYRGEDDGAFDAFWRARLASAAARAPRRLELELTPALPRPGRACVCGRRSARRSMSPLAARSPSPRSPRRVIDEGGAQQDVRLWPTAELGVFEGEVPARTAGRYDIRVETAGGVSGDAPLIVAAAPDPPVESGDPELVATLAAATGGVAVGSDNLQPLLDRLRAVPRETIVQPRHPFRSPWWGVAFAGLLTAEWTLRRRRGLR